MKKIFLFTILLACTIAQAQDYSFQQANQAYANGDYKTAISLYQSVLDSANRSTEVYYNLGNAYYKDNEIGLAILNYERALLQDPSNKDAKYNLSLAQERITDNIEAEDGYFLSRWVKNLILKLKAHTWMWISVALFLITLIGLFIFFFSKNIALRKTGFHCAWIALLFSITTLSFCIVRNQHETSHDKAIVLSSIVNAKASPDHSGTDLFVLHEGTKVSITDTLGEWVEIEVGNYKGWIQAKTLERI